MSSRVTLIYYFVLILLVLCCKHLSALDVSFLPNDENAPLPLSAKYRDALRRLCVLLDENRNLPQELEVKKPVLRNLCKKLKQDDLNIAQGMQETRMQHSFVQSFLYLAVTIGSGYMLYQHKEAVVQWVKKAWTQLLALFSLNKKQSVGRVVGQQQNPDPSESAMRTTPTEQPASDRGVGYDLQAAREARLRRFASAPAPQVEANH